MFDTIVSWIFDRKLSLLCSLGLAAIGLTIALPHLTPKDAPTLRMSAGPAETRRHAVAEYLCEQASEQDLWINLVNSAGSEECLNLLKKRRLDVAIISSGVKVPEDENITVLGILQPESVHVLVRKELADERPLSQTLRGKRVNLGVRGSTEWLLSQEFLSFARLRLPSATSSGDVVPLELSKKFLTDQCKAILSADLAGKERLIAELPDCLLVLDTMPCSLAQLLIEAAEYEINPLPATRAFLLDHLQDSKSTHTIVEREFLEHVTIPANSYFCSRGYPPTDCETVGVRLLVVARKDVAARAIQPLMKTLFESELAHRMRPLPPTEMATQYAIHPAAVVYLDRDKPMVIVQQATEWINSGLSFFGAFSAGALSLYSLIRSKKSRKPTDYLAEIRKLGETVLKAEAESQCAPEPHAIAKRVDEQLLKLRQNLIEDVCEGRIKGDQSVFNILMLLKETRRDLPVADRLTEATHGYFLPQKRPAEKAA